MPKKYETLVIQVDGSEEIISLDKEPQLRFFQNLVGGYIQVVPCVWKDDLKEMIINEEGKFQGFEINLKASKSFGMTRQHGYALLPGDHIVGIALIPLNYEVN